MHPSIKLVLMILAFLLFALSACGVSHPRVNLVAAGLASWVLALILT
jgi:hypothetical protein